MRATGFFPIATRAMRFWRAMARYPAVETDSRPEAAPDGFAHGVPTELLEKCGPKAQEEILFAQRFPGWNGDKTIFCLSSLAGIDSSGRAVHLGLLFILEPGERPQFDLPSSGLSKEDGSTQAA